MMRIQSELVVQRKTAAFCVIALISICAGCGETNRGVFKRYENQFAQKRQQFKEFAQMLPPAGSVREPTAAKLSPEPVYDVKSGTYNTEIVMYDQLLDPDIESQGHNRLDLLLSGDLLRGIQWTGPKNPMTASALDRKAGDMEQTLKNALGYRYLVALRPVSFVAPVATDESSYKPGAADIEGFVLEMAGNKIVGSFRFTAQSAGRVEYAYKQGESREGRLESSAYSSLYSDARQKLAPLLQQSTGGQFVLEK